MNTQKGFSTSIGLLLILVAVAGIAWYLSQPRWAGPAVMPDLDTETFSGTTTSGIAYSFKYPSGFEVKNYGGDDVYVTKYRSDRVFRPIDCGGFQKETDELEMHILVGISSETIPHVAERYESFEVVPGFETKVIRGGEPTEGMCGTSKELIWKNRDDSYVDFGISPFNTQLTDAYMTVIETFEFK